MISHVFFRTEKENASVIRFVAEHSSGVSGKLQILDSGYFGVDIIFFFIPCIRYMIAWISYLYWFTHKASHLETQEIFYKDISWSILRVVEVYLS